jgi:hypothetical protein
VRGASVMAVSYGDVVVQPLAAWRARHGVTSTMRRTCVGEVEPMLDCRGNHYNTQLTPHNPQPTTAADTSMEWTSLKQGTVGQPRTAASRAMARTHLATEACMKGIFLTDSAFVPSACVCCARTRTQPTKHERKHVCTLIDIAFSWPAVCKWHIEPSSGWQACHVLPCA